MSCLGVQLTGSVNLRPAFGNNCYLDQESGVVPLEVSCIALPFFDIHVFSTDICMDQRSARAGSHTKTLATQ